LGNNIVDEPDPEGNDSGCLPVRYLVIYGDRRKGLVAVLQLYMDESYSHPPAPLVYTIAGYVSESYRWSRFEREWQKVLDAEGIEFFHMKDYAHKRGAYADWTDKKRIKFLRTLQHIIKSNTEKDFAISLVVEDYNKLIPPNTQIWIGFGEPHVFVVIGCMKDIGKWQKSKHINKPVHYIFEKGSGYDSMLKRVFEGLDGEQIKFYRVNDTVTFAGKNVLPLQAADMLAYENRLELCRRLNPENRRKPRESLKNLERPESHWVFYDEPNLQIVLGHAERAGLISRASAANE
jgi:hypothetical protein